jgi:hypothetical protein
VVFSSAVARFNSHNWRCMLANMANKSRHFAACGRSDVKLRCSFPRVRSVLANYGSTLKTSSFLVLLLVSKFAAAEMLVHPIQVSSSNISTVVFEENTTVSFNIDQTVLDLLISSVAKDKDEYHVFFHCQATKRNSEGSVTGIAVNELNVATVLASEHASVDCGFGKLLQISLANKPLKRDS